MVSVPILEEHSGGPAGVMIADLAGLAEQPVQKTQFSELSSARPPRRLSVYPASAGFDLVDELDHLCVRTIEPNIFFNPRFLAPAMPRLEDREVRLAVIRDEDDLRSRLRLLMPYSIERLSLPLSTTILRIWSSPFGPLGTPLIDQDDPVGVLEDFLAMLARPHLKLPKVLVMPDIRLDGPVAQLVRTVTLGQNLPLQITNEQERPFLDSEEDGDAYLEGALSAHHRREFRRLRRRLADQGEVTLAIARQPDDIRRALEDFLALEASGWKGRGRSAMATDRFRAAFAREAVHRLSQQDHCRVHTMLLDGRIIASLIVFVEAGIGYTWKTTYDEQYSAWSPGTLLMLDVTRQHLEDPNIMATDSCAAPDHPVMSRLWRERRRMGTLVVGLTPNADRTTRQVAKQLHIQSQTRNMARHFRDRLSELTRKR